MKEQTLTAERARALLRYNRKTGTLTWKVNKGRVKAGSVAGYYDPSGYVRLRVDQASYWAHRVIWLLVTGAWPEGVIDHRNADGSDNRWRNPRDATRKVNQENQRRAHRDSKTGILGVHPHGGRFAARITISGSSKRLGLYETSASAHRAYVKVKRELHTGCTL